MKQLSNERLFQERWEVIPGEKLNKSGDLEKSVKTGRLTKSLIRDWLNKLSRHNSKSFYFVNWPGLDSQWKSLSSLKFINYFAILAVSKFYINTIMC